MYVCHSYHCRLFTESYTAESFRLRAGGTLFCSYLSQPTVYLVQSVTQESTSGWMPEETKLCTSFTAATVAFIDRRTAETFRLHARDQDNYFVSHSRHCAFCGEGRQREKLRSEFGHVQYNAQWNALHCRQERECSCVALAPTQYGPAPQHGDVLRGKAASEILASARCVGELCFIVQVQYRAGADAA